ncbi:MAG TPA: NUDIX hydrolase [Chthoniobacteraceae bacterium]|nr:NUDIX hydrolase [Chthoniobacteraceae bacterium]
MSQHNQKNDQIVWEGKYLRVRVSGTWEYAERPNSPAGVVIVAVTPEGDLLLTEQFRIPLGQNTIELPAGLSGDDDYAGEHYLETAKRELLEETGYEAAHWEELTQGPPSAGLSNEVVVFYLGKNLRKVSAGGGEGSEKIHVHHVPLTKARAWLKQRAAEGATIDPKVYVGLYFLSQD